MNILFNMNYLRFVFTTHWVSGYHQFEEFLKSKVIEHSCTKVRHLWTNGSVKRFHKTLLEEFYQPALLKKTHDTFAELQHNLD